MNTDSPKPQTSSGFRFTEAHLRWIAHFFIFLGLVIIGLVFALQPGLVSIKSQQQKEKKQLTRSFVPNTVTKQNATVAKAVEIAKARLLDSIMTAKDQAT